jgi:hypothetical protein
VSIGNFKSTKRKQNSLDSIPKLKLDDALVTLKWVGGLADLQSKFPLSSLPIGRAEPASSPMANWPAFRLAESLPPNIDLYSVL